jgi:hypothetical protein
VCVRVEERESSASASASASARANGMGRGGREGGGDIVIRTSARRIINFAQPPSSLSPLQAVRASTGPLAPWCPDEG